MPMIEIDENELAGYRNVTKALQTMLAHPEARRLVQQAQKTVNPNSVIPEIDAAKPVLDAVGALRKEFEDDKKAREEAAAKAEEDRKVKTLKETWERGREAAKAQGYTKEGLESLEKFMEERGVADHEVAIPAFERLHPQAKPVETASNRFDFFNARKHDGDEAMKMLLEGNDEGFLATTIPQVLADVRGR